MQDNMRGPESEHHGFGRKLQQQSQMQTQPQQEPYPQPGYETSSPLQWPGMQTGGNHQPMQMPGNSMFGQMQGNQSPHSPFGNMQGGQFPPRPQGLNPMPMGQQGSYGDGYDSSGINPGGMFSQQGGIFGNMASVGGSMRPLFPQFGGMYQGGFGQR